MSQETASGRPASRCARATELRQRAERRVESLVSALKGTLRVLVVDDDDDLLALFTANLQLCSLFDVHAAGTVEHARSLAGQGRWHCWLVDLYVPRIEDGMALIRDYASAVPILVLSGRSTGGDGYQASQKGIVGFLDKGAIDADTLIRRAYGIAVRRLLCPGYPSAGTDDEALAALFERSPGTVGEWAGLLSVTPRALERRIDAIAAVRPGTLLALQSLYALAFRRCMSRGRDPISISRGEVRLLRHYHQRTSLMDALLSQHGAARAS